MGPKVQRGSMLDETTRNWEEVKKMTFTEAAERFQFDRSVNIHTAIRIVEAYVNGEDNAEDTCSQYIVRAAHANEDPCDGCGDAPQDFIVEQRHPEGGSVLCERCWLQEEGR